MKEQAQPPRWLDTFLAFYCKDELLEDLQGDLHECFSENLQAKGNTQARLIYFIDVIKFIRPYTVQKPEIFNNMNFLLILQNYFKTSVRNITKNWTFSLINIIGLAISISVGLLMLTMLNEMKSYDRFHSKLDRIYRINNTYANVERDELGLYASTSVLAGRRIQNEISGLEKVVLLRRNFNGLMDFGEKKIPARGLWASDQFFELFDFEMIKGNPSTALKEIRSIVITETAAKRLFGDIDPLNKTVNMGDDLGDFNVTGVMKDPPHNSHLQFEMLGSFNTIDELRKEDGYWMKWDNMWANYVYLLLEEDTNLQSLQAGLNRINEEENSKSEFQSINMLLQPMSDIALGEEMSNQIGKVMDSKMLYMIAALTFVVLLSACFNYSNLSIARSLRRSKEVGIRKVVGASKAQVFYQFIFESILVALFALLFAYLMFIWLRPNFLSLDDYLNRLVKLEVDGGIILQFVALAVATGIIAGFFPSIFFSKMNPNMVLKSNTSIQLFKGLTIRRALIVFQFALSISFILAATLMNKQYRFALSYDLGYSTENILNLELKGNDVDVLKNEIAQLSDVEDISSSLIVTSIGDTWGDRIKYKDPGDSIIVHYNSVDNKYLPLHEHQLVAGSNFTRPYLTNDSLGYEIIVSKSLLDYFNIESPEAALGEIFTFRGRQAQVIGVINDFQYTTINNVSRPFVFRNYTRNQVNYLNIKINSSDQFATRDKIEAIWKKIDDVQPIEASFYDDDIEEVYTEYEVIVKIIGYLAFLAITIALLGLLGMVIFTTETRLREIGIRKVLGATEGNLVFLMGRGFMFLLLISAIVAVPATYLLFDNVVFAEFVNRAGIGLVEIFGGTLLVFVVAALTISSHTIRAARINPSVTLRNE